MKNKQKTKAECNVLGVRGNQMKILTAAISFQETWQCGDLTVAEREYRVWGKFWFLFCCLLHLTVAIML